MLEPKFNGKVQLYIHLVRLNQVLMTPGHRCLAVKNDLPKLANVKFFTLIYTNSGYHHLKVTKIIISKNFPGW